MENNPPYFQEDDQGRPPRPLPTNIPVRMPLLTPPVPPTRTTFPYVPPSRTNVSERLRQISLSLRRPPPPTLPTNVPERTAPILPTDRIPFLWLRPPPLSPQEPHFDIFASTRPPTGHKTLLPPIKSLRPAPKAASATSSTGRSRPVEENIDQPYPWATSRRAQVHTLEYLRSNGIKKISNMFNCTECFKRYEVGYDLDEGFSKVANYIIAERHSMDGQAPAIWWQSCFFTSKICHERNCVMPTTKKRSINWLFLLLGQNICHCTDKELRYFCKHNGIRGGATASRSRLLYLVYLALCKQLDPSGPFDP